MDLIADGLLVATTLTAALYLIVLSRRLRRLTDASSGIGARIQALNGAIEDAKSGLAETKRGVAEAKSSVAAAREALAADIAAARHACATLETARTRAQEMLAQLDEAERDADLRRRGSAGPAPRAARPDPEADMRPEGDADATEDLDDTIPDWPDGVVNLDPAGSLADDPGAEPETPLRVRRVEP